MENNVYFADPNPSLAELEQKYDDFREKLAVARRKREPICIFIEGKGIECCVRLKDDWWLAVKDFVGSSERERIVNFELPQKDREKLPDYPDIQGSKQYLGLIKVFLDNGDVEVLCTSVLNTEKCILTI